MTPKSKPLGLLAATLFAKSAEATERAMRPVANVSLLTEPLAGEQQMDGQLVGQMVGLSDQLTNSQLKVLLYLIGNAGKGRANRSQVTASTGIPYGTVCDTLRKLVLIGFITKPKRYHNGPIQGFTYSINRSLCDRLMVESAGRQIDGQLVGQLVGGMVVNSSSSVLKDLKTTTTRDSRMVGQMVGEMDGQLDGWMDGRNDPELVYWIEKGLTERQIEQWAAVAGVGPEQIIAFLKYYRFDMVDLGKKREKASRIKYTKIRFCDECPTRFKLQRPIFLIISMLHRKRPIKLT